MRAASNKQKMAYVRQTTYSRCEVLMKAWLRVSLALLPLAGLPACDTTEIGQTQQALTRANEFYAVAHMTNTLRSVQWAVQQGANGLEMDLQFNDDGTPKEFRHGGFCDCSCATSHPGTDVCAILRVDSLNTCEGSADARAMMAEIVSVRSKIALVFIDSKVDESHPVSRQERAGKNVIDMLRNDLFARGYGGKVVVSVGKPDAYQYIDAAAKRASELPDVRDRIYFAFDQNGKSREDAATTLSLETRLSWKNRAYGTGISRCASGNYEPAISTGDLNEDRYVHGLTYLWTIDSESSMDSYLSRVRPRAIITNVPSRLRQVAERKGMRLAEPETALTDVVSTDVVGPIRKDCRCNYHKGGCTIAEPAPAQRACKCTYIPLWTCRGDLTNCQNSASAKCNAPDGSKESCEQGGGDCGGYR